MKWRKLSIPWNDATKNFLVYSLPIFLALYGLKCLLFLSGALMVHNKNSLYMRSFHFETVTGKAAALTGLGYLTLALFASLSVPRPPGIYSISIRIGLSLVRWSGLIAMFYFWIKAEELK